MSRKYYIILSLFAWFTISLFTADEILADEGNRTVNQESLFLHTDRSVYVAGESIHYKYYIYRPDIKAAIICSKILYIELRSAGYGKSLSWRINIDGSTDFGVFPLPDTLTPGIYTLFAYTNPMRQGEQKSVFKKDLLIVSLSKPLPSDIQYPDNWKIKAGETIIAENTGIIVETEKDTFKINEDIPILFKWTDEIPDTMGSWLSLSVTQVSPFDSLWDAKNETGTRTPIPINQTKESKNCRFAIEDKGFILKGKVINRNNMTPLSGGNVWLAARDSTSPGILYARTDASGNFTFYLRREYDNRQLIIQLDEDKQAEFYIEIQYKSIHPESWTGRFYPLSGEVKEYLNQIMNLRVIEAIYNQKTVTERQVEFSGNPGFSFPPEKVIIPSDYVELINFSEICNNIVPELRFGIRNEKFKLEVLLQGMNEWKEINRVHLNGVPFTNLSYISTLGTREIKRIEIVRSNILTGDYTLTGMVSIYTYDGKIPESYLKHSLFLLNDVLKTGTNHYLLNPNQGDRLPDFRNTLYWNPDIIFSRNINQQVILPGTFQTGSYKIEAAGLSGLGKPVHAIAYIHIKQ